MGLGVTGVSELVLEVDDLEQAEWFYSEILELPVVERWEDRRAIWVMAGDRTRIGLWEPQVGLAGGQGGQHVHYAMHLEPAFAPPQVALRSFEPGVEQGATTGPPPVGPAGGRVERRVFLVQPDTAEAAVAAVAQIDECRPPR